MTLTQSNMIIRQRCATQLCTMTYGRTMALLMCMVARTSRWGC